MIIPLIIVVLIPLEVISSVILLPLILGLLITLPSGLRPIHVVGSLIVVEAEILRRRDTHPILVVVILPCVICSTPRVVLVLISLPCCRPYRVI